MFGTFLGEAKECAGHSFLIVEQLQYTLQYCDGFHTMNRPQVHTPPHPYTRRPTPAFIHALFIQAFFEQLLCARHWDTAKWLGSIRAPSEGARGKCKNGVKIK